MKSQVQISIDITLGDFYPSFLTLALGEQSYLLHVASGRWQGKYSLELVNVWRAQVGPDSTIINKKNKKNILDFIVKMKT